MDGRAIVFVIKNQDVNAIVKWRSLTMLVHSVVVLVVAMIQRMRYGVGQRGVVNGLMKHKQERLNFVGGIETDEWYGMHVQVHVATVEKRWMLLSNRHPCHQLTHRHHLLHSHLLVLVNHRRGPLLNTHYCQLYLLYLRPSQPHHLQRV